MGLLIRVLLGATGILSVLSVLSVPSANAQCENKQLAKLAGAWGDEQFGQVARLDADWALIQGQGNGTTSYKSPQVWRRQPGGNWALDTTLNGEASGYLDQYGYSMDLANGRIAVGAPVWMGTSTVAQGAVYVFAKTGNSWAQEAKLTLAPTPTFQHLGDRVALDGATLLAYRNENLVELFERTGTSWAAKQSLAPILPLPGSGFGYALDVDGPIAAIAAPNDSPSTYGTGTVYVYERDSTGVWVPTAKLLPDVEAYYSNFGTSVSVEGTRILVGAGGLAVVFERIAGFWAQTAVITTVQGVGGFGQKVSLGVDVAVVSAPTLGVQGGLSNSGAAFVYKLEAGSWTERMMLTANDPQSQMNLGLSVDVWGNEVLLGSPSSPTGAAYVFNLIPNPVSQYGAGCAGSGGVTPSLAMKQTYDGCKHAGESVTLDVKKGLGGSSVLLVLGAQASSLPLQGGCSLLLVPTPANALLPLFGSGSGNGSISVNASIPVGFPAVSIFMQGFVFDPGVAQGYCATNGLRLSVY